MADKRNAAVTVEVVHCQHIDTDPETAGPKWLDIGKTKSLVLCVECWQDIRRAVLVGIVGEAVQTALYDTFGESLSHCYNQ